MAQSSPQTPWGWNSSARGLLAVILVPLTIALFAVAPDSRPPVIEVPSLVVDPNTAPPEVLGALPRMGPALVENLVAAREQAPFRSLDDVDARVKRIGPATIETLRPFLRIEPIDE